MKIPKRCHWGRPGIFIINFELFQIFPKFSCCWLWTRKCLLWKFSEILFDICFNVSTGGRQDLTRSDAGNPVIFLISQTQWDVNYSNYSNKLFKTFNYSNNSFKEHWKVCINLAMIFWEHKKQSRRLLWIYYLGSFSILENHKLNKIIDLYKAFYKISMIKYNKVILCEIRYDRKKKGETVCRIIRRKT